MLIINRNKERWRWFDITKFVTKIYGCRWQIFINKHMSLTFVVLHCSIVYTRYDGDPILTSISAETRSSAAPSPATARLRGWLCTVDHVSLPRVYDIRKIPGDGTRTHSQHILKWSLTKKNFSKIIPINERD